VSSPTPGWYPDPENLAQARWFDGANWTDDTQPIDSVSDSTSPSAPPSPGTSPQTRNLLLAGGAVLAVAITVIGGLLVWRSINGVEEVSAREYAKQFCDQFEEGERALQQATESVYDAVKRLDVDYASESGDNDYSGVDEREASAYRDALVALLDAQEDWVDQTVSFASGHQLRGSGGEDLRDDLIEWGQDAREAIDEVRADLAEVDLGDPADAAERLSEDSFTEGAGLNESEEATEVREEFPDDEDDYCYFPYPDS
jgi:hypothetical protein